MALRTQQIIAGETGVANTIDPLGGAYFIEALTDRMEEQAYEYFHQIDELGGMVEAVKRGFPQREIADGAPPPAGARVGPAEARSVNCDTEGDDAETATLKIDPAFETDRCSGSRRCASGATPSRRPGAADAAGRGPRAEGEPGGTPARRRSRRRDRGRDRPGAAACVRDLFGDAGVLSAPRRASRTTMLHLPVASGT